MSLLEAASLTDALLAAKGSAAPSRNGTSHPALAGVRRIRREDGRSRVPLRLDEMRHRRLRLAGAHLHLSAQALLLAALDHYLDRVVPGKLAEGCPCLEGVAGFVPRRSP